ncbi:META domain-containing protein [Nitriliruptoraceae bacterium ZYF776]|nr:META domain-containing protein [Profundirhabdus halotolerans]
MPTVPRPRPSRACRREARPTERRGRRPRAAASGVGLLVLAVVVTACADPSSPADPAASDGGTTAETDAGRDGEWHLTSGEGPDGEVPLTDEQGAPIEIVLVVDGTRWQGHVCNTYDTQVTGDGDAVQVAPIARTEMGCPDARITDAEARYLDALAAVDTVARDGGELTLRGPDVTLTYTRDGGGAAAVPLTGTVWRVTSLTDGEVGWSATPPPDALDPDTPVSDTPAGEADELPTAVPLLVVRDGTFELTTGCRRFAGTVRLSADELVLSGEATEDPVDCGDHAEQDAHLATTLLDGPVRFAIERDRLTLTAGDRTVELRPAADPPT